jgi:hypothetical protein
MKKIALSLATIAAAVTLAASATGAYFSSSWVSAGNQFTTGSLTLDSSYGLPIIVTNLMPGVPQTVNVGIHYTGGSNADIWLGSLDTAGYSGSTYIGNELNVQVVGADSYNNGVTYYSGTLNNLQNNWNWIASNVGNGWYEYNVTFTLADSATNQNVNNTTTDFLFYAVQTGAGAPTTAPYLESSTNPTNF